MPRGVGGLLAILSDDEQAFNLMLVIDNESQTLICYEVHIHFQSLFIQKLVFILFGCIICCDSLASALF